MPGSSQPGWRELPGPGSPGLTSPTRRLAFQSAINPLNIAIKCDKWAAKCYFGREEAPSGSAAVLAQHDPLHTWLSPLTRRGCCPTLKYVMAHSYLACSPVHFSPPPLPQASLISLAAVRHCHFKYRVCPTSGSAAKGGQEQLKPRSHSSIHNFPGPCKIQESFCGKEPQ